MSENIIHPTAIVDKQVTLGQRVQIGPGCVISGQVSLGDDVRLLQNVHVMGPVKIGARTMLYPGACVGFPPQDFKFTPGSITAGVEIGEDCILREHATVHAATKADIPTKVGNRVFMMVTSHVGHDCTIGNNVILANSSLVAGHCRIFDNVMMSGNTAMHQFARIGRLGFLSGNTGIARDLPPFCVCAERNIIKTINFVGMRRAGIDRTLITLVRKCFAEVFCRMMPRQEMIAELEIRAKDCPLIHEQAEFVATSKRGICLGREANAHHNDIE